jgi:hypothetical protein
MATSDDEVLPDTTADLYIDPVAERKLVLKLDLCLSPVMTMIFLAAYLDRSNTKADRFEIGPFFYSRIYV